MRALAACPAALLGGASGRIVVGNGGTVYLALWFLAFISCMGQKPSETRPCYGRLGPDPWSSLARPPPAPMPMGPFSTSTSSSPPSSAVFGGWVRGLVLRRSLMALYG